LGGAKKIGICHVTFLKRGGETEGPEKGEENTSRMKRKEGLPPEEKGDTVRTGGARKKGAGCKSGHGLDRQKEKGRQLKEENQSHRGFKTEWGESRVFSQGRCWPPGCTKSRQGSSAGGGRSGLEKRATLKRQKEGGLQREFY